MPFGRSGRGVLKQGSTGVTVSAGASRCMVTRPRTVRSPDLLAGPLASSYTSPRRCAIRIDAGFSMTDTRAARAPADAVACAERALYALMDEWTTRYGEVVADVTVRPATDGSIHLAGNVLLATQRVSVERAVTDATGLPVTDTVVVLTDRADADGWVIPAGALTDILATPGGARATQLTREDPPARRLARRNGWTVLEAADGTVGWALDAAIVDAAPDEAPADVTGWRTRFAGTPRAATDGAWRAALAPWLGVPYLWGGTTRAGVDCSGLAQRLYHEVIGVGLPRHSRDQARCGERIARVELAPGDLLYLTRRGNGVNHVAVVVRDSPLTVGHASREQCAVIEERLDQLLERYQLRAARRMVARRPA
jgi:cell wall-associated NlpC family hydrolase